MQALVRRDDRLVLEERAAPTRRPGQLLVSMRTAVLGESVDGVVVGTHGVGVVREGVGSLAPGLRVLVAPYGPCRRCTACRAGADGACRGARARARDVDGVAAERVVVDRQDVLVVPEGVPDVIASTAGSAYAWSVGSLADLEATRSGTAVVATVDVRTGLAAAHVLAVRGWRVVVVGADATRRAAAGRGGASVAVDPGAFPAFSDAVLDVTDGRGAEVLVDTSGEPAILGELARGRAPRCRLVALAERGAPTAAAEPGMTVVRPVPPGAAERSRALSFIAEHGVVDGLDAPTRRAGRLDGSGVESARGSVALLGDGPGGDPR